MNTGENGLVRKLLYVEDNEDNLYMLQLWFDVLGGYEILSARDGATGIAMAASERPDLILMDLNLPEIDREKALATGCDDFDTKPVEFDRLLVKIEQALANS